MGASSVRAHAHVHVHVHVELCSVLACVEGVQLIDAVGLMWLPPVAQSSKKKRSKRSRLRKNLDQAKSLSESEDGTLTDRSESKRGVVTEDDKPASRRCVCPVVLCLPWRHGADDGTHARLLMAVVCVTHHRWHARVCGCGCVPPVDRRSSRGKSGVTEEAVAEEEDRLARKLERAKTRASEKLASLKEQWCVLAAKCWCWCPMLGVCGRLHTSLCSPHHG